MNFIKTGTEVLAKPSPAISQENNPDWALVQKVQAGEVSAFDQLVTKYRERLYSTIYNLTSNREDAADLTQETFIKAFQSIQRFKGNASFFTWLYRIGVNTTLTYLKKRRRRRFFNFDALPDEVSQSEIIESLSSKSKTDKPTFMKELQEKLNEGLQMLSLKHRTVVVLFEIEGLTHQEIAKIMKCREATVRSRLFYAKQQLQAYLKDYIQHP